MVKTNNRNACVADTTRRFKDRVPALSADMCSKGMAGTVSMLTGERITNISCATSSSGSQCARRIGDSGNADQGRAPEPSIARVGK
jgi:hypothetical protein